MPKLELAPRLARRSAQEMIMTFARVGNHYSKSTEDFSTDAAVKRYFETRGHDFSQLVERCRDPGTSIPYFENLAGNTLQTRSSGGLGFTTSVVDRKGNKIVSFEGDGEVSLLAYLALFEQADRQFRRVIGAVSQQSEFLAACTSAVASVEGYIGFRAAIWNEKNPDRALLDDQEHKTALETKLRDWVPLMSGKRADLSDWRWQGFVAIKSIRHDQAIHPKSVAQAASLQDLALAMNHFRGLAGFLLHLHSLFADRVPAVLIRAAYRPDVIVS